MTTAGDRVRAGVAAAFVTLFLVACGLIWMRIGPGAIAWAFLGASLAASACVGVLNAPRLRAISAPSRGAVLGIGVTLQAYVLTAAILASLAVVFSGWMDGAMLEGGSEHAPGPAGNAILVVGMAAMIGVPLVPVAAVFGAAIGWWLVRRRQPPL